MSAPSAETRDDGLTLWSRRVRRAVGFARGRVVLRGCVLGSRICVDGVVHAKPDGGVIVVRSGCVFLAGLEPTRLVAANGATLAIGEATVVNYGAALEADGGDVDIGCGCLLASGVRVLGTPSHPVRIGRDVWLAHGAVVTPGVRIGDGAVVAAASVVSRDVPSWTLAIGNPARALSLELFDAGKRAAVRQMPVTRAATRHVPAPRLIRG